MDQLSLVPAYGRQYQTVSALLKDWQEGKDFRIVRGPYCSVRDVPKMLDLGFTQLVLYTNSWRTKSHTVKLGS